MIVVGKTDAVLLADLATGVELVADALPIVQGLLGADIWTDQVLHADLGSLRGFFFEIFIDVTVAGHEVHTRVHPCRP